MWKPTWRNERSSTVPLFLIGNCIETAEKVSHETIYQYIWQDKQRQGDLYKHLRIGGSKLQRKKRGSKDGRGKIPDRADIDHRPKIAEKKKREGDWEAGKKIVRLLNESQAIVHTITFDNGRDFSWHGDIAKALECQCYFAKPYHSRERGLNENANGLIRQYFPKKADPREVSREEIDFGMTRLNNWPRKSLDYQTPNEVFYDHHHASSRCCI